MGELPPRPDNLEEVMQAVHGQSELSDGDGGRASLEPAAFTEEDFKKVHKAYYIATAEEAQSRALDTVEGALALDSLHYKRGLIILRDLDPLTPDNLIPGYPDRTYGARAEELYDFVRRTLSRLILPTAQKDMACPNFVVHVKGPDGRPEVAKLQSVYYGALAVRGMEAL